MQTARAPKAVSSECDHVSCLLYAGSCFHGGDGCGSESQQSRTCMTSECKRKRPGNHNVVRRGRGSDSGSRRCRSDSNQPRKRMV